MLVTVDESLQAAEQSHNFLQSRAQEMPGSTSTNPRSGIEIGMCHDGHHPEECGECDCLTTPGKEDEGVQGPENEIASFESAKFKLRGECGPGYHS
jgi:hypothetical protein